MANRDAHTKQRLDGGVSRVRMGSIEQMRAIDVSTASTGDVFVVPRQGLYLFDSAAGSALTPPWSYTPLVGAGAWLHVLAALRGAPSGLASLDAVGKVAAGQVSNQTIALPFWSSTTLSQTITGGAGPTDITGAVLALGALSANDVVDVDATFGDVQAPAGGGSIGVRITDGATDRDVPGLAVMRVPQRIATGSASTVTGAGRYIIPTAGNYVVRARATAVANGDITLLNFGMLRVTVVRP
ncbi:hypothetical protein LZC95_50250 [Pendulispora brunnea]|uniref:Uncharacterized protein n=1 Tax=Pendulispora brunnea TaxID=2905690 RepID=A0ABZ2K7C4_9BACT